jgi:hypothetical protein
MLRGGRNVDKPRQTMRPQPERNLEIIRRHKSGEGPTAIARQLGMKRDRVRQIIGLAKHREKHRAELVERYGESPDIAALPDETPIDVLALCPGDLHGWEVKVRNLAWLPPTPVRTLGALRKATDAKLRRDSFVGKKFLAELRRFCPGSDPAAMLKGRRDAAADARAAFRMIREVVEQHAPPGSVPSEEVVEPPFVREAEALVRGVLAIVKAKD